MSLTSVLHVENGAQFLNATSVFTSVVTSPVTKINASE